MLERDANRSAIGKRFRYISFYHCCLNDFHIQYIKAD